MTYKKKFSIITNKFPEECCYFKEETLSEIFEIPFEKPNIHEIVDLNVSPQVEDIYIVDEVDTFSTEGRRIVGLNLIVKLLVKENLIYLGTNLNKTTHVADYCLLKSLSVLIPETKDGLSTRSLVKSGRINVVPYVETVYKEKLNERTFFSSVLVLVDVNF